MTNNEMAKAKPFMNLCERYNVTPTARQASKFRRGQGLLHKRIKGFISINSNHRGSV